MANNIIFVGDSYCSDTNQATYDFSGQPEGQSYKKGRPGYPTIVADHYRADLFCHGYAGKSWWYSRVKFQQALRQNPSRLANTHAVIFCHTDAMRINSNNKELSTLSLPHNYDTLDSDWLQRYGQWGLTELADATRLWLRHICDIEFQDWAQQQYFQELAQQYSRIKTIHFHCFEHSVGLSDLLPGMVYTTALGSISAREPGAKSITDNHSSRLNDPRANHFNKYNNRALAQVIIGAIDNYSPGQYTIDLTEFDIV